MACFWVGRDFGGVVLVPMEDADVIDPRVMNTMSCAWAPLPPPLTELKWISETVIVDTGSSEIKVALVSAEKLDICD